VTTFNRRNFLRGAGGVTVALPFLPSAARAQSTLRPKRVVILFSPNGGRHDAWSPDPGAAGLGDLLMNGPEVRTDHGTSFVLDPLAPHWADVTVLEGLAQRSSSTGPGDGHQRGMGHMLTGTALQEGSLFTGGNGEGAGWGGGISVDQRIANVVGQDTRFASLELGVQVHGSDVWSRMSYSGPGQPIPPESDPNAAFDRIFQDLQTDPAEVQRRKARRRSVLDFVRGDFEGLLPRLGAEDRAKVDQHFTAVREIERRLYVGPSEGCTAPQAPGPIDHMANDNFPVVAQMQMDILAMALACDLTRVGSIQFSQSVGNARHTWQGLNDGHHTISHDASRDADINLMNRWYAEQVAYFIQRLKEIPDGDGTLFDNTVIFWTNELDNGGGHSRNTMPYVLAGSCGGALQTGKYIRYPNVDGDVGAFVRPREPHNNLLLSLCRAMDLEDTTFGDPEFCDGVLDDLMA
jgi:hypothetical protein